MYLILSHCTATLKDNHLFTLKNLFEFLQSLRMSRIKRMLFILVTSFIIAHPLFNFYHFASHIIIMFNVSSPVFIRKLNRDFKRIKTS